MSPIRTKPFRTRSAGQQTTKVLDGKCRVFPSTIDAGGFATPRPDVSQIALRAEFMRSNYWYSDTPYNPVGGQYMIGYNNRISGYSTNTGNNTEGYFIVRLNKMCRIHYDLTISSENNYDWGYVTLSQKGNWNMPYIFVTTGSPQYMISRMSGETSVSGYIDMDNWAQTGGINGFSNGPAYDIGVTGEDSLPYILLAFEYDTDGSSSSGSNRFTINSLYVTDLPAYTPVT